MTPEEFDGRFSICPNGTGEPIVVTFYRRETETRSIGEFIDSIKPENIAWDAVTRQLFYKTKESVTYKLNFEEL